MFDSFTRHEPISRALPRPKTQVAIFHGRTSFEDGATSLIGAGVFPYAECAVLQVSLRGEALADPGAGRKLLSLAANILRARVTNGALAYLGEGRFAVLLQGVSGRDAVAYCRDAMAVLDAIRLQWRGQVLTVESGIGGVMAEAHRDGLTLLEAAAHAAEVAGHKHGCKLHMLHEQLDAAISVQEEDGMPAHTQTRAPALVAAHAAC
jgi:hypothetical protein